MTGTTNNLSWSRRQIRVKQENAYCNLTLWNNMVEEVLLSKCEKLFVLLRLVSLIEIWSIWKFNWRTSKSHGSMVDFILIRFLTWEKLRVILFLVGSRTLASLQNSSLTILRNWFSDDMTISFFFVFSTNISKEPNGFF